jgi:hypothetical protein
MSRILLNASGYGGKRLSEMVSMRWGFEPVSGRYQTSIVYSNSLSTALVDVLLRKPYETIKLSAIDLR